MTATEYVLWEREQRDKHEFHHGEVFAMAGGSPRHNALCAAVVRDVGVATRGGECRVLSSDQQVALPQGERYVYPDATVVCGRMHLAEGSDALLNPSAVVEVLSSSTERYDRGEKWAAYQKLESLRDYVIVSQREPRIEHFRREPSGAWSYAVAERGQRVTLGIGASLEVDAIYEGVFELRGDEDP